MERRNRISKTRFTSRSRSPQNKSKVNKSRQYRLSLNSNTKSQKTLTQINFVNRLSGDSLSDLNLEYLDEDEDGDDGYTFKTKTNSRPSRKGSSNHSSMIQASDTTLTQMGYSFTRDETDENDMIARSPVKEVPCSPVKNVDRVSPTTERALGYADDDNFGSLFTEPRKKRKREYDGAENRAKRICEWDELKGSWDGAKVSVDTPLSNREATPLSFQKRDTAWKSSQLQGGTSGSPITPQKQKRGFVPSSQSPESPEVTFSCTRRNMSFRSPVKSGQDIVNLGPNDTIDTCVSPSPRRQLRHRSLAEGDNSRRLPSNCNNRFASPIAEDSSDQEVLPASSLSPWLPSPEPPSTSFVNEVELPRNSPQGVSEHRGPERESQQIVYETDGEVNNEDFRSGTPQQSRKGCEDQSKLLVPASSVQPFGTDDGSHISMERVQDLPSEPDASLCYARQYSTYPHEKYMRNERDEGTDLAQDNSEPTESELVEASLPMSPHPNRSVSGVNDLITDLDLSTESVPESSPVRQHSTGAGRPQFHSSPAPFVLVESSQPADRPEPNNEQNASSKPLVTTSQLLPESLMDSIPTPPGWLSSQIDG